MVTIGIGTRGLTLQKMGQNVDKRLAKDDRGDPSRTVTASRSKSLMCAPEAQMYAVRHVDKAPSTGLASERARRSTTSWLTETKGISVRVLSATPSSRLTTKR